MSRHLMAGDPAGYQIHVEGDKLRVLSGHDNDWLPGEFDDREEADLAIEAHRRAHLEEHGTPGDETTPLFLLQPGHPAAVRAHELGLSPKGFKLPRRHAEAPKAAKVAPRKRTAKKTAAKRASRSKSK